MSWSSYSRVGEKVYNISIDKPLIYTNKYYVVE